MAIAAYPIASQADGGILYSDGTVRYSSDSNAIGSSNVSGYPIYPSSTGGGQVLGDKDIATTGDGGTPTQQTVQGEPSGNFDMLAQLQRIKDEKIKEAQGYYDTAKSYFDQMMGLLGNKGTQFQDMFNQGNQDIASTFETSKGNARRTAGDLESIEGNRARALGLAGSATDYAANRRNENLARTMGNINQVKGTNEMENKRLYDTRQDWKTGQEAELSKYLGDASTAFNAMKNTAVSDFGSTAGSYLDQILQNQLLANQANLGAGISGYEASPYSVDTASLQNYLTPILQQSGLLANGDMNANPVDKNSYLSMIQDPRKRLSGLYPGLSA